MWCGSGKSNPQRPYTHALLISRIPHSFHAPSHWKQAPPAMKDLTPDFPGSHFPASITRASHSQREMGQHQHLYDNDKRH